MTPSETNQPIAVDQARRHVEPITRGPACHWFGYYDKWQFDATDRYALGAEVTFENRQPRPTDRVTVGMVDLQDGGQWTPFGASTAWSWQTGCNLQWRPGRDHEVIWNDREEGRFVTRVLDVQTRHCRTLPFPVFAVHPQGRWALGLNFARLEDLRPGYGYVGLRDPHHDQGAPEQDGIYLLDLDSENVRLLVSLAQLGRIPRRDTDFSDAKHYVNCLLFNPRGDRFAFLHRWREDRGRAWPFRTRIMTAALDGSDIFTLNEMGCGHFIWRDNEHLLLQTGGFWLFRDGQGPVEQVGAGVLPNSGGHVSYLPGGQWIVGDTYPDEDRRQMLYLYHVERRQFVELAGFHSPPEYAGETPGCPGSPWRCDLHPRISRGGNFLCVDSAHQGGRQMYLVEIGSITHGEDDPI